ncbi:MAG: type II toxin-antitoxin system HicA family toxin [Catalinimonas sp.]
MEHDGRLQVRQRGSHRVCKHAYKPGHVTVPVHRMSDEIRPDTLNRILKQAGPK